MAGTHSSVSRSQEYELWPKPQQEKQRKGLTVAQLQSPWEGGGGGVERAGGTVFKFGTSAPATPYSCYPDEKRKTVHVLVNTLKVGTKICLHREKSRCAIFARAAR